jgi:hypothetical protein
MDMEYNMLTTRMDQEYLLKITKINQEMDQLHDQQQQDRSSIIQTIVLPTSPIRSPRLEQNLVTISLLENENNKCLTTTQSFDFLLDLWQTVMQENGERLFYDHYETNKSLQKIWKDVVARNQKYFRIKHLNQLVFKRHHRHRSSSIHQTPHCKVCNLPIYKNRLVYHSSSTSYYVDRDCELWLVKEVVG